MLHVLEKRDEKAPAPPARWQGLTRVFGARTRAIQPLRAAGATAMRLMLLTFPALLVVFSGTAPGGAWRPQQVPFTEIAAEGAPLWLRCFIRVPDNMATPAERELWRDSVMLSIGGVSTSFSVFLNAEKIGESGALAEGERRRFKVPKGLLQKGAFNTLALRLEGAKPQLSAAPILLGYLDELVLEGEWQLTSGEPAAADLAAQTQQPLSAFYTEAGFQPSRSPLAPNAELVRGASLPPAESLAKMTTASDIAVELVLHEPEVAQPTHISFDERGRMWVAQYRQYPYPRGVKMISRDRYYRAHYDRVPPAPPNHDRGDDIISVHEDTDGDGVFDHSRVVLDGLNLANAAVRGHCGIWVMHAPYLLFYPDANDDDVPDRDPEVRLSGFGLEDTHSTANGLAWGPDGWLYGAQGSTTTSRVTRPGIDPDGASGVYHEGPMVWRYHPQKRVYELFATGGGNVFGIEFDSEGRLFSGHNGGDTRGWHYVQSGAFLQQSIDPGKFGPQVNSFAFGYLDMMKSRHPVPRFSHATIVFGGTALPEHYRDRFFSADPLRRHVVVAERYPRGSTFETSDSAMALTGADPSFRPVFMTNAPDGAIYVADFYEEFIAHGQNYQGQIDPGTGRIYRLRGKGAELERDVNLKVKTGAELVKLLSHPNRWHRHTAVRLLGEQRDAGVIEPLRMALAIREQHPALEALWVLHQLQAVRPADLLAALRHPAPALRMWAVRLAGEAGKLPEEFAAALLPAIASEPDAEVRSQVASTAKRLAAAQALPLIRELISRDADADDPYLPLLCWWALEPHAASAREAVIAALSWESQMAQQHILPRLMRRFAAGGSRADLLTCAQLLESAPTQAQRQALMRGFEEAFKGRALPPIPAELARALAASGIASRDLRVRLGEPEAITEALTLIADGKASVADRLLCIRVFGEVRHEPAAPVLLQIALADEKPELRKAALSSLLAYDLPEAGEKVAAAYTALPAEVQPAAQTLLTSRAEWCAAFLQLVESGKLSRADIPAPTAALLLAHAEPSVGALARKLLAAPEEAAPQDQTEIARLRAVIAGGAGDPYRGEPIYEQRCAACHKLFHKGGSIGPDLTAYQRHDLGTLLPSLIDPSAEVREGFQNHIAETHDGRTLSGFIVDQDQAIVVLRGLDGQNVSIARKELRELRKSPASLMPPGLLGGLDDQALRDFFAYLRSSQPITR